MSDSQLRELERLWRETGSAEDEARYLLERVRVGDLQQEKLELAAYCGHEGAEVALGKHAPQPPGDLEDWARNLGAGAEIVFVAATVAAANAALPVWEREVPQDARPREAISAAMAWLECPCTEHADLAGSASDAVAAATRLPVSNQAACAAEAALWAARAPSEFGSHASRWESAAANAAHAARMALGDEVVIRREMGTAAIAHLLCRPGNTTSFPEQT